MQREADTKLAELFYPSAAASEGVGQPRRPVLDALLALGALDGPGDEEAEMRTPAGCGQSHSDPVQDRPSNCAAVSCSVVRELVRGRYTRCDSGLVRVALLGGAGGWAY